MLTFLRLCARLATCIPASVGLATVAPTPTSSSSPCRLTCGCRRFPASVTSSAGTSFLTYFSVMKTGAAIVILSTSANPRSTLMSKSVSFSFSFCGGYFISGLSWGGVHTIGGG